MYSTSSNTTPPPKSSKRVINKTEPVQELP